jgi:hypothetical protein
VAELAACRLQIQRLAVQILMLPNERIFFIAHWLAMKFKFFCRQAAIQISQIINMCKVCLRINSARLEMLLI